jgi:hypothetical protein
MLLLGDEVTVMRDVGDDTTWLTGRISGIVQDNHGVLKHFYIKGIDVPLQMTDGWKFQEEEEYEDGEI